ncbi:MAG: hypothetical protein ACTHN5_04235 [Phycisphaerae bacterium]
MTLNGTLAANTTIPAGSKLSSTLLSLQNANVSLQSSSSLPAILSATEIAGTGTIRLDGNPIFGVQNMLSSNQNLTIDSGVSVRTGNAGGILYAYSQTINYGLISVETPGAAIAYAGSPNPVLNNKGLISITAGAMFLPANTQNSGTISLASNGTLVIPSFNSISGTFSRTGGTVAYTGNLTGTGNTIDLNNPFWGPISLDRSNVSNLTLTSSAGPVAIVYTKNPSGDFRPDTLLSNVTLGTDIEIQPGGTLEFANTVTLNNKTIHLNGSNRANATLILNLGTFSGNGTLSFDGGSQFNSITNAYQIPAGVTLQTGTGGGTITQGSMFTPYFAVDGTISAQTPATTISLSLPTSPLLIQPDGVVQAINGGNIAISGPAANSGLLTIDAPGSITCTSTFTENGPGTLAGNGTLNASKIAGTWNIPLSVHITGTGMNSVASLSFANAGQLDIGAADLQITSSTGDLSAVSAQVARAFNGGSWDGIGGITSSALTPREGIAVMTGADYRAATRKSSLDGALVLTNNLLLKTALLGDANLDNQVDLSDLSTVLNNFGQASLSWTHGNFDYAPTIDLTDLSDVLNHFGQSLTTPTLAPDTPTPTPEPTPLALLTLAAPFLYKRRR